jgi:hypothetical protein
MGLQSSEVHLWIAFLGLLGPRSTQRCQSCQRREALGHELSTTTQATILAVRICQDSVKTSRVAFCSHSQPLGSNEHALTAKIMLPLSPRLCSSLRAFQKAIGASPNRIMNRLISQIYQINGRCLKFHLYPQSPHPQWPISG